MKRLIINQLISWKENSQRKPLILNGARQVGKTYILKAFGKLHYRNVAYVNLDSQKELAKVFEQDFNVTRIIRSLSAFLNIHIEPQHTLIVLDEVQECPAALHALKYFCEDAPEYHVVVAGSLLGISLHGNSSFPVGKVDMLRMFPLTFEEFLMALGEEQLIKLMKDGETEVIDTLSGRFVDCLRQYYYTGGMPAVVKEYITSGNLQSVRQLQKQILFDYRRDFSKHAPAEQVPRINLVWDSIPAQLARENKKFIYGALKKGGRAKEFEMAIQWLIDAGLVYRVYRANKPSLPLKFYEDLSAFKLFSLDVGLMGAMADSPAEAVLVNNQAFVEYKGAMTELYVLTQLQPTGIPIYYYSSNDSLSEIDFLVQSGARIVPIEVKAEVNVKSKSLSAFIQKHPDLTGLRLSLLPFQTQDWMENRPLYAPLCWLKE
ncbi:MAG: ATP-binding protein [Prevotellamassilia sp.]|nr:ATP-binding protein [Prevotellamassilia sp.]MDY4059086.1 ATP-binding protein [Alloprevotella sp.]MDD7563411.1 ATP-binding protein [Prevotellamassilia sp.]MDY4567688.1 ATP-binding protein [Alloprevotella sp.]MDY5761836.1 ATP-binding protein [Alloprevotella sp.]